MNPRTLVVEVWGDLACFTRPEMKVERYSYPCITPSAARGVLEAIYRKPEFRWQVERVEVLTEPRYIALRRNEVKNRAPGANTIMSWVEGKAAPQPIWADESEGATGRTQRQTMALRDVRYRIHARILPWDNNQVLLPKYQDTFERRVQRGQCVWQPCFGCREFPAFFSAPSERPALTSLDQEIGWMVYDVFDLRVARRAPLITPEEKPFISVFHASIRQGVLEVPPFDDDRLVRKPHKEAAR